jgi:hypothetical protein
MLLKVTDYFISLDMYFATLVGWGSSEVLLRVMYYFSMMLNGSKNQNMDYFLCNLS